MIPLSKYEEANTKNTMKNLIKICECNINSITIMKLSFLVMAMIYLSIPQTLKAKHFTEEKPLIIVGDWECPPYEYIDEDGMCQGFNIEMLQAILKEMGIPYKIELKDWTNVLKDINTGKADLACATYTRNLEKKYFFNRHSFSSYSLSLVYRDGVKPIHNLSEIKKGHVIIKNQDIAYYVISDSGYADRIDTVADIKNILKGMSKGQYDMAIWGRIPLRNLIYKYKFHNLELTDINLPSLRYHFISKDSELLSRVDSTFITMKMKGQLDDIYSKWFSELPERNGIPSYVYYIVGILLLVVVSLYTFTYMLRYKVKKAHKTILYKDRRISIALRSGNLCIMEYNTKKQVFNSIEGDIIPKNELTYDFCEKTMHPDDFIKLDDIIKRMTKGLIDETSLIIRRKTTGQENWTYIETTLTTTAEHDNNRETLICTLKNITENVNKQEEEKELLEKYAVVFNSTSVGLVYYDKNGILLDINETACKILNSNREEVIANKISFFDNEYLSHCISEHEGYPFYATIKISKNESSHIHPNIHLKSDLFLEIQISSLYDDKNMLQSIIVTIIDVTELHNANKIANESMNEIQATKNEVEDYANKINYALKVGDLKVWNYDPASKTFTFTSNINKKENIITQEQCLSWVSKSDYQKTLNGFKMMDNCYLNTFSAQFKYDHLLNKHTTTYISFDGIPVKDTTGKITGYFGLMKDITSMINLQNKLKEESQKAQEADRLKSMFLANMSHGIRTPLNAIVGFSNLLETANDIEERNEFVKIINHNSEQLLRLINDILDLSRLDANIIKIIPENIDFTIVFNHTCETLKQRISVPEVDFTYDSPCKSCQTYIDYNRISQVITNFVINASKYTSKGHIKVGYENIDDGLKIYCEDTGCGIPKDKCDQIFDRFVKLNEFVPGTGLGLSICKTIADHCNGTIGVDSVEGIGSTFWIWIPCKVNAII
jgi:signal transduction histidine kinase/ABC-type amino acid transport substrate-binding protein